MNRWAMIQNDAIVTITAQNSTPLISGEWVDVTDIAVGPGWRRDGDEWLPPTMERKTILTHREFIILLGPHYAAIERLRDTNALLPPDQKNYDLARLFALWDAASYIDLADEDLAAAFEAFVGLGIMTQAAVDGVLAG